VSNPQHVPEPLASNTKQDGVNVAVSAAAVAIAIAVAIVAVVAIAAAIAAAVKTSKYGLAVQASRGTVAWSDLLYDDEEDRWYSRLSHSASYDDEPHYRWPWGVMVSHRQSCVKAHLDGGSTVRTLPSAASHPGEVVVAECLRPSRTVCWGGTTRRTVLIDAVERTAPAMRQVVVPAGSSGALV
jgi:hypothetical protein